MPVTEPKHTQLYVHTYAYRFRLHHDPDFTIFDVIADARRRGFDGINVSVYGDKFADLGLPAAIRGPGTQAPSRSRISTDDETSGHSTGHFAEVRAAVREAGLGIDIETVGTEPDHLRDLLRIGAQLGAENLRTFMGATTGPLDRPTRIQETITNLIAAAPFAAELGILLLMENGQVLDSAEVGAVVEAVNSPWVRAVFDYGNDMPLNRHPLDTLDAVLPWITTAHLKDQIVYTPHGTTSRQTLGVPIGHGRLPIRELTTRLIDEGIARICLQPTWAYVESIPGTEDGAVDPFDAFCLQQLPSDDPRYCTNAATLEQTQPRYLVDTEPLMLDESCAGLRTVLAGLPITLLTAAD